MSVFIIAETNFDAALIVHVLRGPDLDDMEVRASSAASSLARTFLSGRRAPVTLVLDAHSSEVEVISRLRQEAEEALRDVAPRDLFRVVIAIPELEVVFFQSPDLLRRLYGNTVTEHLIELANYSARAALQKLAPTEDYEHLRWQVLRSAKPEDLAAMRQSKVVKELIQAVQELRQRSLIASIGTI